MNVTHKFMVGIVGAFMLLAFALTANAAVQCVSGTVSKTGIYTYSDNTRAVFLTCDAAVGSWNGAERMFFIPAGPDEDAMYAAALTAKSTSKKVEYFLARETATSLVRVIYVLSADVIAAP